jgi:hypothetical protein
MIDKAIEFQCKVLNYDPTNIKGLLNRARLYELAGKSALATADRQRADKLAKQRESATHSAAG